MPIILDHQLREPISFHTATFPITLFSVTNLHLSPIGQDLYIGIRILRSATAVSGVLDFQVGAAAYQYWKQVTAYLSMGVYCME